MRKCCLFLLSVVFSNGLARAQAVQVGVVGGVPLSPVTQYNMHEESRPYLIGPSIQFRLPANFAIEVDGIYRRIGGSTSFLAASTDSSPSQYFYNRNRGNSWEVPILAKYYFQPHHSMFRPFVASGFSLRTIDERYTTSVSNPNSNLLLLPVSSRLSLDVGAVATAGIHFKAGRLAFEPQLRYTRWGSGSQNRVSKNQADFVLGIRF